MTFSDLFASARESLGWQPDATQLARFEQLFRSLTETNKGLNLTRIVEPQEFWEKHLWDSLRGLGPLLENPEEPGSLIDIGTGGGFPGMPAAIALPGTQVTLLDSTRKKLAFLDGLIAELELPNVRTWVGRAEEAGRQRRAQFDLATIRAVGPVTACAEYCLPLLKLGGLAVLYRGQWSEAEEAQLERALEVLGGELEGVDAFELPLTGAARHCLWVRKIESTPKHYPRAVGLPAHKPL